MANIKSAKKRVRSTAKKEVNNNIFVTKTKNSVKKVVKAVENEDKKNLKEKYDTVIKNLDKAASRGLIKKNKAARDKSRITKLMNKMEKQFPFFFATKKELGF